VSVAAVGGWCRHSSVPVIVCRRWFGLGGLTENRWLANQATVVASLQVGAIVVGHVLGIVSAHDRAVRLFPPRRALVAQLPLLAVMIGYTVAGLLLLFAA
jgi:hypothetical protein